MLSKIAPLALFLVLACDPSAPAPCGSDETETGTGTGTGTEDTAGLPFMCCQCPSGSCVSGIDEATCEALSMAAGLESHWCETDDPGECLSQCSLTTVCCGGCDGADPTCKVWPDGEVDCLALGPGHLWCEDATPESCAALCG